MLDAYIIDRIRREQEENRRQTQVPLHIERPPPERPTEEEHEERKDRGTTVIDFHL